MSGLRLRPSILAEDKLSYISGDITAPNSMVDCSEGSNPYGCSALVLDALSNITSDMVCEYPHDDTLRASIAAHWGQYSPLTKANILLTDGSISGLYLVNSAFSIPGAALLTISPQFSDYTSHAKFMDMEYRRVYLCESHNYRFEPEALLERMEDGLSLVYLDHPNNPTGQAIPLDALRAVLNKAEAHGVCVIVDEAYGDYMEDEQSAITLLGRFNNLIVLRTFSKGYGLAGLRGGILLASETLCMALNKLSNPYMSSQLTRLAAAAALKDQDFIKGCRSAFTKSKTALRAALGKNLRMAETLNSCPICLLSHVNAAVDLRQEFQNREILTFSGVGFDGLSKNSVRLRMPHERQCGKLLDAVRDING